MKNNKFMLVLFLLALGIFFVGCTKPDDEEEDPDDDPIIPTLTVASESVTIKVAETSQINATISGTTEVLTTTFVSSNEAIATVSTTGLITAVAVGQTTITVGVSGYATVTKTVAITVEKVDDPVPVNPLTLTGLNTVAVGQTITLTATDSGNPENIVFWESTDTSILKVTQEGVVSGIAGGVAKVIITSFYTPDTLELEITVTIPEATGIEIAPITVTPITLSTTFKLSAKILPIGATGEIVWESSNEAVATVDADGKVKPIGPGEVTMKATLTDTTFQAEVTFTVTPTPIEIFDMIHVENPIVKSITVFGWELNSTYTYEMYASVSKYLPEQLNVTESLISLTLENRPGIIKESTEYITVHDTASAAPSAGAVAHNAYVTNGGGGTSWHYTVGNDGIFHHIPNNEVAYHAGDGSRQYAMNATNNDSGIVASGKEKPIISITVDGYYALNGEKTQIIAPTNNGAILPTSRINDLGIQIVVGENGNWWIGNTWYSSTYNYIGNGGGNRNSVGIESCVNKGSDVFLTWQLLAKLVAFLLEEQGLGFDRIVQHHYYSGKDCPMTMRHADMWNYFKEMVQAEYLVRTVLQGYNISFQSSNPELINANGRVIDLPAVATRTSYTLRITNDSGYDATKVYYVNLPAK
ncbi:MAG: Ig-like domain-containing protein [Bacilli bacterium]